MVLDEVMKPCHRLSARNRGVNRAYIESLKKKEFETAWRLLEVEELLAK